MGHSAHSYYTYYRTYNNSFWSTIRNSECFNNNAIGTNKGYGGALYAYNSNIKVHSCSLMNNTAHGIKGGHGGAMYGNISCDIEVRNSTFWNNSARGSESGTGGAIVIFSSFLLTSNSNFTLNTVVGSVAAGGVVFANGSNITSFMNSVYTNNSASGVKSSLGGSFCITFSNMEIWDSTFRNNIATGDNDVNGGAVYAVFSTVSLLFYRSDRGVIFCGNSVTSDHKTSRGGALFLAFTTLTSRAILQIIDNKAGSGTIFAEQSTLYFSENTTISNNHGSLFSFASHVIFTQYTTFENNVVAFSNANAQTLQEGGAVTAFKSEIYFIGSVQIIYNAAQVGGGILLVETSLYTYGNINIEFNRAALSGGGIYAYQSELNLIGNTTVSQNTATEKGGGIHAITSNMFVNSLNAFDTDSNERKYYDFISVELLSILTADVVTKILGEPISSDENLRNFSMLPRAVTTTTAISNSVNFVANYAKSGGGLYLEANSKLYISKFQAECSTQTDSCTVNSEEWLRMKFVHNSADFGGALYVADDTYFGSCYTIPLSPNHSVVDECFFQDLAIYNNPIFINDRIHSRNLLNTYFTNNSASVAGGMIYGGLLDRCTVNSFAEYFKEYTNVTSSSLNATTYLLSVTNLQWQNFNSTAHISSHPVRICFCQNNYPDCSTTVYPHVQYVNTGQSFKVSLVAVDQVNNVIPSSSVHASLSIQGSGGLDETQAIQQTNVNATCTELTYTVLTPQETEQLLLYADGPCIGKGISASYISINIVTCPIGFINTSLRCDCDPYLHPDYISDCSIDAKSVQRLDRVWIAYVNNSEHEAYVHHRYCPFDYCHPPTDTVFINLNIPDGSDSQCAFNRSGKLCGSCGDGLSLMLGSSRCMPCGNSGLALLIVFAIAGVVLVAFLLVCNLTVAVGTINGLIFYANIIAANHAVFLPFRKPNILTVFIAWLNLDFGIETCFYDGMSGYANVWLQFLFPLYILFLVVLVIVIANYSQKFARLLLHKNPVATLATLILLSYAKFIRIIIAGLSSTKLQYSDGFNENIWLYDGNIPYLEGKHVPLFLAAITVLLLGSAYTFLLFFWHWLMLCMQKTSSKTIFELPLCISTSKVYIGLGHFMDEYLAPYNTKHRYWVGLLLIVRVVLYLISAVNVLANPSINLVSIVCIMVCLLILLSNVPGRIYKEWPIGTLESSYIFNLTVFTVVSLYIREVSGNQEPVAYTSLSIAFVTFLATVSYHAYEYIIKNVSICNKFPCSSHVTLHNEEPAEMMYITGEDEQNPQPTVTVVDRPIIALDTMCASKTLSLNECNGTGDDNLSNTV